AGKDSLSFRAKARSAVVEESRSSGPNGSLSGRLRFLDSLRSLGMTTLVHSQIPPRNNHSAVPRAHLSNQLCVIVAPAELVIQHQQLWPRPSREVAELVRRRVIRSVIRLPVRRSLLQLLRRHHLVHEDVA